MMATRSLRTQKTARYIRGHLPLPVSQGVYKVPNAYLKVGLFRFLMFLKMCLVSTTVRVKKMARMTKERMDSILLSRVGSCVVA